MHHFEDKPLKSIIYVIQLLKQKPYTTEKDVRVEVDI